MIDAENLEFYPLGDINCDLLAESPDISAKELLSISTIYNLSQIISSHSLPELPILQRHLLTSALQITLIK